MREAAKLLLGKHDFSAFRSSECQSPTPVKTVRSIEITRRGAYWRFEFDANAFLHHMVRNIVGTLVVVRRVPDLARYKWTFALIGIVLLVRQRYGLASGAAANNLATASSVFSWPTAMR